MFRPKHTFQSVAEELIAGLETGSVTLDAITDGPGKEDNRQAPATIPVRDGRRPGPGQKVEQPGKGTTAE